MTGCVAKSIYKISLSNKTVIADLLERKSENESWMPDLRHDWFDKGLQPQCATYPFEYVVSQYQMGISQQFVRDSFYSYLHFLL